MIGICGRVWDSGVALCDWLGEGGLAIGDGDLVLEVGSGVGVGGIAAASVGARVLLTDLPEASPALAESWCCRGRGGGSGCERLG